MKVLDFGLAKMFVEEGSGNDPWQAPPITTEGTIERTREGVIAGTATYMSPEQARGRPVDKRTDIWAFGCVLYEMLTGRPAFAGETVSDTIAAILERDPDWDALPALTPVSIRRLLQRCLEKDPKRRVRDIGDARLEIEEARGAIVSPGGAAASRARRVPIARKRRPGSPGGSRPVRVCWSSDPPRRGSCSARSTSGAIRSKA